MNIAFTLIVALLFFVLSPDVLFRFPRKGSKFTAIAFHAILFALVFHFTHNYFMNLTTENFIDLPFTGKGNATINTTAPILAGPIVTKPKPDTACTDSSQCSSGKTCYGLANWCMPKNFFSKGEWCNKNDDCASKNCNIKMKKCN